MNQTRNRSPAEVAPRVHGLKSLSLTAAERTALARQGSVSAESRHRAGTVYKLRFRVNGRQVVKYLGTDPAAAAVVRRELEQLQRAVRTRTVSRRLVRSARALLRDNKQALRPEFERAGFFFHGYAVRRRRCADFAVATPAAGAFSPAVE